MMSRIEELKAKIAHREEYEMSWLKPAYDCARTMKRYRVSLLQTAKLVKELENELIKSKITS